MNNTGAGIHAIKTMKETAVVRTKNDCLEIVIGDVTASQDLATEKVEPGQPYH